MELHYRLAMHNVCDARKIQYQILMLTYREAIAVVESLKKTRADLESKAGVYKPDELYSLLQVSNENQFQDA